MEGRPEQTAGERAASVPAQPDPELRLAEVYLKVKSVQQRWGDLGDALHKDLQGILDFIKH